MQFYTHIYTGEGKGKSTAALGLALRAVGHGWRVYIGQFAKGMKYSELNALERLNGVDVELYGWDECMLGKPFNDQHRQDTLEGLQRCEEMCRSGDYQVVILDEVLVAIHLGLLDENCLLDFVERFQGKLELVLTGRYASESMLKVADLVTEIRCLKHYYREGVLSRKGVDC